MEVQELKRFIGDFTIVPAVPHGYEVPAAWNEIFEREEQEERIAKTIQMWAEPYQNKLSSLLNAFDKFLTRIDLIRSADALSILYTFTVKGDYRYYVGKNPHKKPVTSETQAFLNGLPDDFILFYQTIHNGWYEVVSEAMGLAPVENFIILSEQEWGILDEIRIDFSLNKVVSVFSNSSGGYLCWDYNRAVPSGLIWWHDEAPDTEVDFWDTLDEWTTMGIEE